jgi:flagellar motor protein MotB
MRNFIISLSILFFILAGFITFKGAEIPVKTPLYQNAQREPKPDDLPPKVEAMLGKFAREQEADRALVEELRSTISTLEDKLSNNQEEIATKVEAKAPEKETRVLAILGYGVFQTGRVILEENLKNAVNEIIPEILATPEYLVVIEGHTSTIHVRPSAGKRYIDNMELSEFRAKAVASILIEGGIPRERMSITGYGDTRPIASNATYEGRVVNRRVEIKLITGKREL